MLVIGHAGTGDPVAVVYYLCELKGGGRCTPRDGLYHVHNGIASDNLPVGKGGAKIYHVPDWNETTSPPTPNVDELRICGPEDAANPPSHVTCHESSGAKWAVAAFYTYSVGVPVTWIIHGKPKEPHNGVFVGFRTKGQSSYDPDIANFIPGNDPVTLEGNLQFQHYVNADPVRPHEDGRTARGWERFTLETGWAPDSQAPGTIHIAKMEGFIK